MSKIELMKKINEWNIKRISEIDEDKELDLDTKRLFQGIIELTVSNLNQTLNFIQEKIDEDNQDVKFNSHWLLNLTWLQSFDFESAAHTTSRLLESKSKTKTNEEHDQLVDIEDELYRWNAFKNELFEFGLFLGENN